MLANCWLRRASAILLVGPLFVYASAPINVALEASFSSAPYLIELLETAAEENSTSYFPILDRIAEGFFHKVTTDQKLYESFIQLLQDDGHITDPETLSSFQFALSVHSAAPRVEAHYQYYNTTVEPSLEAVQDSNCDAWVAFSGKQYCSPELEKEHGALKHWKTEELPFDRMLGDSFKDAPRILYADITSPDFSRFHKAISRSAQEGKASYCLRYKPSSKIVGKPLIVNGYGVELALKKTDYIVIDDRDAEQSEGQVSKSIESQLQEEEVADLKPLSTSEVSGLGFAAAGFVMGSQNPFDMLLKLTQDFPKHSAAIAAHNASEEFRMEHHRNRELLVPSGLNIMWINGVQLSPRNIDPFSLLDHLRRERKLIKSVQDLGLTGPESIGVLSHPAIAEIQADDEPQRYDWRDQTEGGNVIIWLNDLEKDSRYDGWPDSINSLLQRTFPGQLPAIRRDIHNAIFPIDFSNEQDVSLVVETLQAFVKRKVPIRWGLVPRTPTASAASQARVIYHLLDTHGLGGVVTYLQDSLAAKEISTPHKSTFEGTTKKIKLRKDHVARSLQEVLQETDLNDRIESAKKYLARLGADGPNSPLFINGVPVSQDDEWMQNMSNRLSLDLRLIQKGVFEELFKEESWLPEFFLVQSSLRRNPLIIPENEKNITMKNLAQIYSEHQEHLDKIPRVPVAEGARLEEWAHLLVVADLNSETGARLVAEAAKFRQKNENIELLIFHNGKSSGTKDGLAVSLYHAAKAGNLVDILADPLIDQHQSEGDVAESETFWKSLAPLTEALGLASHQSGILVNGRVVGPILSGTDFTENDFEALLSYERKKRIQPAATAVKELELANKISTPFEAAKLSSLIAVSAISEIPEGIFESTSTLRMNIFDKWNASHTAIITGDRDMATVQIVATIDPASEVAQRLVPILKVLSELSNVHLRLFLNPKDNLSELPVKRFYRYVFDSKPSFENDGSLRGLHAQFTGLPAEALLTMGMDVAPSWLVAPKESIHDLDNIKLSSLKTNAEVDAVYELENILIEGHSRDVTNGMAPRGAELILGTEKNPHFADTIIMANLGYFQFKANPGVFRIQLKEGPSQEIFQIDTVGMNGASSHSSDQGTEVALTSFQGVTLFPRFSRKPGKEDADVLAPSPPAASDFAAKGAKFADKVLSKVGLGSVHSGDIISKGLKFGSGIFSKSSPSTDEKTIAHADVNIFSVASGHLYERMLNIMTVSVMRHTNHTVKFWFIEQFLSPSFKSFLPTMAEEYGFEYEMVTYKWPHWLRGQKEKQREIWGYKILFLDVLFPLDLDKVIFVDADQIVRTDMYELVTHNLQGAPYGFTPMCDSRTEMEGFRFWKQGYWRNTLRGLPYHISALYVVDLKRFRQMAAGDRLRQQYQMLSADPNSLSNLDQDLPNNMQMSLPIHSLPQEWLWCETWCSDESLKDAKTIDLCNNPMTKEPKLDRARRQVPEWTVYDEEIAALARRTKEGDGAGEKMSTSMEGKTESAKVHPRDEL